MASTTIEARQVGLANKLLSSNGIFALKLSLSLVYMIGEYWRITFTYTSANSLIAHHKQLREKAFQAGTNARGKTQKNFISAAT